MGRGACVANYMCVAKRDTECGGSINSCIHAGYCLSVRESMIFGKVKRKGWVYVPTAYFFAGGRARSPCLNVDAYASFDLMRFSWTGVGAMSQIAIVLCPLGLLFEYLISAKNCCCY